MTRDEWMVLSDGTRLHRSLDGRQYYASGDMVYCRFPGIDDGFGFQVTLAEFEALLFAPAASAPDDYTRAGMAWAEAEAAWVTSDPDESAAPARVADEKRVAFLRLYRERHGV